MDLLPIILFLAMGVVAAGVYVARRRATRRTLSAEDRMKSQHYVFAHVELPGLAFSDPQRFLGVVGSPQGPEFLQHVWNGAGERLPEERHRPPEGLSRWAGRLDDETILALITLPPPQEQVEAWFVAVVAPLPERVDGVDEPPAWLRYFTLEHGVSLTDDQPYAALCEWDRSEGAATHRFHSADHTPEAGAFIEAIRSLLAAE